MAGVQASIFSGFPNNQTQAVSQAVLETIKDAYTILVTLATLSLLLSLCPCNDKPSVRLKSSTDLTIIIIEIELTQREQLMRIYHTPLPVL